MNYLARLKQVGLGDFHPTKQLTKGIFIVMLPLGLILIG